MLVTSWRAVEMEVIRWPTADADEEEEEESSPLSSLSMVLLISLSILMFEFGWRRLSLEDVEWVELFESRSTSDDLV